MNAIRIFEAAAEQESFALAADELHVTRGAISQQIKQLEVFLGTPLFTRTGRGLTLTDAGRRYHSAVRNALNILERETVRYVAQGSASTLRMSVLPAIASLWLVPRLGDFQKRHDDVEVQVSAEAALIDLARSDTHVAIRYGLGDIKGCEAIELGVDRILPVCSPDYRDAQGIASPRNIEGCRLLHDTYWVDDWSYWERGTGQRVSSGTTGQYFTHYSLAVDAALAGAGVLMGHEQLIARHLDNGALVPIGERRITCPEPYFLVFPRRLKYQREVQAFVTWFTEQFGDKT